MKKEILGVFFGILLILFVSSIFACVSYPTIQNKKCNVSFDSSNYNNETNILKLLNTKKLGCGFDNDTISLLKDFVVNGYSVKQQNDDEYAIFLEEAKKQNEKLGCGNSTYKAVSHKGNYTGYILDIRANDETGKECPQPNCSGAIINILWDDLIPPIIDDTQNQTGNGTVVPPAKSDGATSYLIYILIGVVVIIILIFIIMKFQTKKPIETTEQTSTTTTTTTTITPNTNTSSINNTDNKETTSTPSE